VGVGIVSVFGRMMLGVQSQPKGCTPREAQWIAYVLVFFSLEWGVRFSPPFFVLLSVLSLFVIGKSFFFISFVFGRC